MSEWIDFSVFAIQAIVLWIALPRHAARFTRPMLFDRNPQWAAANPELVAKLEHGGWWFKALQAWAIVTVIVLLMVRLGKNTPGWEVLMTTSNALMAMGFVLFGLGIWRNLRWLKRNVPLAEIRRASLAPRSIDDFVPRWMQYLIYGFMAVNILARPAAELIYPGRLGNIWGASILMLIMSLLMYLVATFGVARPPNQFDHAMGPNYRRLEVHVYFGIMVAIALTGLLNLLMEFNGLDMRRYGAVITGACATAALVAFMFLPITDRTAGQRHQASTA